MFCRFMRTDGFREVVRRAGMAALLLGLIPGAATAQVTVLDFEDIDAGTTVTAQYGPSGVLFQQAYLGTDPAARSGTRVLRTVPPNVEIFNAVPLVMTFTSAQTRVKLFAGSPGIALNGTLTAYDANDAVVAQDGPRLVAQDVFTTSFEVTVASASIVRVELQLEGSAHQAIDDLEFEGEPPAPPPLEEPEVRITTPPDGAELDVSAIDIGGTVTGEGLLSLATLTMEYGLPPESTAPPFRSDLVLTGSGTTRQFTLPGGFYGLPLGPIEITVDTENSGGLKGSDTVIIVNLPAALRARFTEEGGTTRLGPFQFGLTCADGGKLAIYLHGAIGVDAAGVARLVEGNILTKWLALRSASDNEGFGCPLSEERPGPGASRVQDFSDGRIYANLATGTVYVPNVFLDVIDTLEVEFPTQLETVVPVVDPVAPVEPVTQTWLYQQFTRPSRIDLLPATLEIRGTPPRLWVARQLAAFEAHTAAVWDDFPCTGNQGPCAVEIPAVSDEPISNPGDAFCGGTTLAQSPLSLEWTAILDNHISTPIFGVVKQSKMAGSDLAFTHQWTYGALCFPGCPSDWTMHVEPVGPHEGVVPYDSLFTPGNLTDVELEYERFYGDFVEWMGRPEVGDLIYAAGRWIIDCGHSNFQSELHPVFMYAKMKIVTSITDPFTGLMNANPFGGRPATRADVWVNGWYPGDPIEFEIYPPPRPSPTARLVVSKPIDAQAAFGVNMEYSIEPAGTANHVRIRFTAPIRRSEITLWGEMLWGIHRGYEGQWYVYWAD